MIKAHLSNYVTSYKIIYGNKMYSDILMNATFIYLFTIISILIQNLKTQIQKLYFKSSKKCINK